MQNKNNYADLMYYFYHDLNGMRENDYTMGIRQLMLIILSFSIDYRPQCIDNFSRIYVKLIKRYCIFQNRSITIGAKINYDSCP